MLVGEIRRIHPTPFRRITNEQFDQEVQRLDTALPSLSDAQAMVGLMRLVRLLDEEGTQLLLPDDPGKAVPSLPIELFAFKEGLIVASAAPEAAGLIGSQVVQIDGRSIGEIREAMSSIIGPGSERWMLHIAPMLMTKPAILSGLGLLSNHAAMRLTMLDRQANLSVITMSASSRGPDARWVSAQNADERPPLYLHQPQQPYWFVYDEGAKTVYLQFNSCRDDPREVLASFCGRLKECLELKDVTRLILDMRNNGDGQSDAAESLIDVLSQSTKVNRTGGLFVIVGRKTSNGAMAVCTRIERRTRAVFAGEPTGMSPGWAHEAVTFTLPNSGLRTRICRGTGDESSSGDARTSLLPQILAPPTFEAFRTNRDPALEAILNYSRSQSSQYSVRRWHQKETAGKLAGGLGNHLDCAADISGV
jgi:hypothetical protein